MLKKIFLWACSLTFLFFLGIFFGIDYGKTLSFFGEKISSTQENAENFIQSENFEEKRDEISGKTKNVFSATKSAFHDFFAEYIFGTDVEYNHNK